LKTLALTSIFCLMLAVAGCGGDDSTTAPTEGEGAGAAESGGSAGRPKVTVPKGPPPEKLEIREIEEGDGAEAKAGDEVTVQYVGVNYRSGKEFDASWDRGEPFPFQLGAGMVIPGWDKGVEGMKVGRTSPTGRKAGRR
jgi:FKBP-type peptidyl-prolyl cis-trans isomerase